MINFNALKSVLLVFDDHGFQTALPIEIVNCMEEKEN